MRNKVSEVQAKLAVQQAVNGHLIEAVRILVEGDE